MPAINPALQNVTTCEEFIPAFCPPWLSGRYGSLWNKGIADYFEDEYNLAHDAAFVGFPEKTPSDALNALGAERMLERINASLNLPGETELDYRLRLKNVWGAWGAPLPPGSVPGAPDATPAVQHFALPQGIWEAAGSAAIHMPDIFPTNDPMRPATMAGWPKWLGLTSTSVYRQHEWMFPPFLVSPYYFQWEQQWSTFWVIINQPHPFQILVWGAPGLKWGTPSGPGCPTWGTTATVGEVELIKRLVVTFKSGHSSCAGIVLFFGTGMFWGVGVWGTGVWGGIGQSTIIWPVGEPSWYQ